MWDVIYLAITVVFFAAMLWYVGGCQRLGDRTQVQHNLDDQPAGGWRTGED